MATKYDLGCVLPIGKGDWNAETTYERTNIVRHNNSAWVCKVKQCLNSPPSEDNEDWYLLVRDNVVTNFTNIPTIPTAELDDNTKHAVNAIWVNNKIKDANEYALAMAIALG